MDYLLVYNLKWAYIMGGFVLILLVITLALLSIIPESGSVNIKTSDEELECIDECVADCQEDASCIRTCLYVKCDMESGKGGMGGITTTF